MQNASNQFETLVLMDQNSCLQMQNFSLCSGNAPSLVSGTYQAQSMCGLLILSTEKTPTASTAAE